MLRNRCLPLVFLAERSLRRRLPIPQLIDYKP